jgi:hypothetical protein
LLTIALELPDTSSTLRRARLSRPTCVASTSFCASRGVTCSVAVLPSAASELPSPARRSMARIGTRSRMTLTILSSAEAPSPGICRVSSTSTTSPGVTKPATPLTASTGTVTARMSAGRLADSTARSEILERRIGSPRVIGRMATLPPASIRCTSVSL